MYQRRLFALNLRESHPETLKMAVKLSNPTVLAQLLLKVVFLHLSLLDYLIIPF